MRRHLRVVVPVEPVEPVQPVEPVEPVCQCASVPVWAAAAAGEGNSHSRRHDAVVGEAQALGWLPGLPLPLARRRRRLSVLRDDGGVRLAQGGKKAGCIMIRPLRHSGRPGAGHLVVASARGRCCSAAGLLGGWRSSSVVAESNTTPAAKQQATLLIFRCHKGPSTDSSAVSECHRAIVDPEVLPTMP
ncbi:hypothetical protein BS50DRAFT_302512 [Corynespora cassiicola Philippines]|uniref:Uncharacterized protein n=1 Tax=Corynespora cassiicola Philippines TaxID=1448308 RepID=A0A2T2NX46_CORCC|nr:hypothetical protein BS50DRAFT_302512 [Corynespora cassiicola Philippines]